MKLCVAVMMYNDSTCIQRLIPNLLKAGVPKSSIKVFDGPFDLFPHGGKGKSTDGSRQYLRKQGIEIVDCCIMTHMNKTNYRLEWAFEHGFDALLGIDCDEYVIGSWKALKELLEMCDNQRHRDSYALTFIDKDGFYETRFAHQRIFLDLDKLFYNNEHWKVYRKDGSGMKHITARWILGGITVIHDSSIRPKKREMQMNQFQERLKPLENVSRMTRIRRIDR